MKKRFVCTSILALSCLFAFSGPAAAMKIDGPNEMRSQTPPLYDQYPCVGVDDVSVYYIDPSSCFASENNGTMVLGALLYATGGGAAPGGGPAKLGQCTVEFTTYLQNGERVIETDGLESKSRRPSTVEESQDFYQSLFWSIAEITGDAEDL